jgi:hypothetical protein
MGVRTTDSEIVRPLPGNLDRGTVKWRFDRCLQVIKEALGAFAPPGWADGVAVPEVGRMAA